MWELENRNNFEVTTWTIAWKYSRQNYKWKPRMVWQSDRACWISRCWYESKCIDYEVNINAGRLFNEYGISYQNKRCHDGRKVSLTYEQRDDVWRLCRCFRRWQNYRHYRRRPTQRKFLQGAGGFFQKSLSCSSESAKLSLQVAFLIAPLSKVFLRYSWQE